MVREPFDIRGRNWDIYEGVDFGNCAGIRCGKLFRDLCAFYYEPDL